MAEETKTTSKRREALFYKQKHGHDILSPEEKLAAETYCKEYMTFLDTARTERQAVQWAMQAAKQHGFVPYTPGMQLLPGTKVYVENRHKALMLAVIGEENLSEGCIIAAAHVDAPRIDLKQVPLYEDNELAYLKTHYYGGIKKYQWLAIPLELHGVVALKDGRQVEVSIGRKKEDPVFVITDLLPHLAADQNKKRLSEAVPGESLNVLIGSVPDEEEGSDRVKLQMLSILFDQYGITEEDFLSAELTVVPALETREVGLDRSLIGGYGHDDRVCAFAALQAILETELPKKTAVCILADKEEIGSEGVSGMQSEAFECFMDDLCESQRAKLRHCFQNSICLSTDVCNGYDPNFPEVSEKRNNAKLNYGVGVLKYTGSRGKSGASDASAELVAVLRNSFARHDVIWQMGELGKVDQGGGGTIAMFMAQRNIDTIDMGVPVLSMHAPYEIVSKLDCYMTYKAIKVMYQ